LNLKTALPTGEYYIAFDFYTVSLTGSGLKCGYYDGSWNVDTGDLPFYIYTGSCLNLTVSDSNMATYDETGNPHAPVLINNVVYITIHVIDADDSSDVENARVYIEADTGGALPAGTTILNPASQLNHLTNRQSENPLKMNQMLRNDQYQQHQ